MSLINWNTVQTGQNILAKAETMLHSFVSSRTKSKESDGRTHSRSISSKTMHEVATCKAVYLPVSFTHLFSYCMAWSGHSPSSSLPLLHRLPFIETTIEN